MILFVLYKVNSLYNVKGGFGDVCVCVCVRGGGAEEGLTYLARSFPLRPSYTYDGRSIV